MRCQVPYTDGKKKIGEIRVLIYFCQKIKKGETMLYDYNEGCIARGESELSYDTSGFL